MEGEVGRAERGEWREKRRKKYRRKKGRKRGERRRSHTEGGRTG